MMGLKLKDQMGMVNVGRFGDDESTLLDKYERLSFEVQLNQAILGRSLSQPTTLSSSSSSRNICTNNASLVLLQLSSTSPSHPRSTHHHHVNRTTADQGPPRPRPKSRFLRVVNKLLTPIFGASAPATTTKNRVKDRKLWTTFSRSLRA